MERYDLKEYKKTIGKQIEGLLDELPEEKTKKKLAEEMGCSAAKISKICTGDYDGLKVEDLIKLANLFDVSLDRFFDKKSNEIENMELGLSGKSLDWLHRNQSENPDFINLLNIILENDNIADALFRSMFIYANAVILKLSPLLQPKNDPIYLDVQTSHEMIKHLSMQYIGELLDHVHSAWEENMKRELRAKKGTKKKLAEKYPDNEEIPKRIREKQKQNATGFNLVDECEHIGKDIHFLNMEASIRKDMEEALD